MQSALLENSDFLMTLIKDLKQKYLRWNFEFQSFDENQEPQFAEVDSSDLYSQRIKRIQLILSGILFLFGGSLITCERFSQPKDLQEQSRIVDSFERSLEKLSRLLTRLLETISMIPSLDKSLAEVNQSREQQ